MYILHLALTLFATINSVGYAKPLNSFDQFIHKCLKTNNDNVCKIALVKTNFYQSNAAKNSNFPCQTRLLGLEANLIMILKKENRYEKTLKALEDVKAHCNF